MKTRSINQPPRYVYVVYDDEDVIAIGYRHECAKALGISLRTVTNYCSPAAFRRYFAGNHSRIAVRVLVSEINEAIRREDAWRLTKRAGIEQAKTRRFGDQTKPERSPIELSFEAKTKQRK